MKRSKGFIIVIALIIAASLTVMVGAFSMSILYRNQSAVRYLDSVKAYYLAAAGIQYGQLTHSDTIFSLTGKGDAINVKCDYPPANSVDRMIMGDVNGDGGVEDSDYMILYGAYGSKIYTDTPGSVGRCDLNRDRVVDIKDMNILAAAASYTGALASAEDPSELTGNKAYKATIKSAAKVNDVTRMVVCEEDFGDFEQSLLKEGPVTKWR